MHSPLPRSDPRPSAKRVTPAAEQNRKGRCKEATEAEVYGKGERKQTHSDNTSLL